MARRVFFSFHYDRDIFRVNTVRNSDVTKTNVEQSGYWDHSLWEETKKKGDPDLKALIDGGLKGTSVTIVLTGLETAGRKWVDYEIVKSFERGNALMTVYVNKIANVDSKTDAKGSDPLSWLYYSISTDGKTATVQTKRTGEWKPYLTISTSNLPSAVKSAGKGFLSAAAASYDWVDDSGYANFAKWIESAAKASGQ